MPATTSAKPPVRKNMSKPRRASMAAILCGLVPEAELIVIFPITEPFPSTFPHAFFFRDPAKKNGRSVKKTPPCGNSVMMTFSVFPPHTPCYALPAA